MIKQIKKHINKIIFNNNNFNKIDKIIFNINLAEISNIFNRL